MSRRASILVPLMLFSGLALAFFYRLAFTDLILARGDTFQYFYPYWDVRDLALRGGEWPLWTNDLYMGAPLLANPQLGTLYPPNWLTMSLAAPTSIKISILLHVIWAALGTYWLGRHVVSLAGLPALVAGVIFAFGGYLGSHVEQINQLQGLSWMPWLFLLYALVQQRPHRYLPLMGAAWAMQLLSGHAQTAFITGIGLGIYALAEFLIERPPQSAKVDSRTLRLALPTFGRSTLILIAAAVVGVVLALPQLIPAQELISLSNRGGGLTTQEATAFSLNPALIGRGLLPSYDGQPFGEYVGTIGVIGLALAIIGATSDRQHRWIWITLALVGLIFALGRYTPIYLLLTNLPGFNLFRVPARWLALVTLAGAMLAGQGVQTLSERDERLPLTPLLVTIMVIVALAASTLLANQAADEVDGPAVPNTIHWVGWGLALLAVVAVWVARIVLWRPRYWHPHTQHDPHFRLRMWHVIALLAIVELFLASRALPYNDVSDPGVYADSRFGIDLMQVAQDEDVVPGRLLSISGLLFDPGDEPVLESRWNAMGITRRASDYAFTATKLKEIIAPNLPLTWGIASIDGFGGGILPTLYYTQFTSLMLPEGTPRSIDGRLREMLAQPECGGECIPTDALLDLTNTRYLLVDKVADPVHEGIFYDPTLAFPQDAVIDNPRHFESDALHLLVLGDGEMGVTFEYADGEEEALTLLDDAVNVEGMQLLIFTAESPRIPQAIQLNAPGTMTIQAATLVDQRTGAHVQLAPPGWRRIYSADTKIYENLDVLPRAFVVHDARIVADDYAGSEAALDILREVDLARTITLHTDNTLPFEPVSDAPPSDVTISAYSPAELEIEVEAGADGWLFLSDAYYPGWRVVDQDGQEREVIRADSMFRAVPVYEGKQTLTMIFEPRSFSRLVQIGGALVWLILAGFTSWNWFSRSPA